MIDVKQKLDPVIKELKKVIVGQDEVMKQIIVAILCDSNALLESYPGLGKTTMVKTMADIMDLKFSRIQSTPDLMPTDIIGTYVLEEVEGKRVFNFHKGPIFANIILADEINRATPKTQSALLEAMQEKQVTVGRTTFELDRPFFVLATQNPIDQEGTYP
ncbi:MAG: AAA family ATPase, partial [Nanoarchaeota archaeon]